MNSKKKNRKNLPPRFRQSSIATAANLVGSFTGIDQIISAAHAHWQAGQIQQAELLCMQVLAQIPDHPGALHLLGLIAHTNDNLPASIELLKKACASPNAPASFHSNLAEIYRQSGFFDQAERAARRALELDDSHLPAISNLAIILQETGKLEESARLLQSAVKRTPENSELHNNLGNTLQRMGLLREAKHAYTRAIDLNPDYDVAYANMARLQIELGEHEAGLANARQAIDLNPQNIAAYLNAAAIHAARDDTMRALEYVDMVLGFSPLNIQALQMRAELLIETGELEEAEISARQALSIKPDLQRSVLVLAKALRAQGNEAEARTLHERVASSKTHQPDAMLERATLLIELNRTAEAREVLQKLLTEQPRKYEAWLQLSSLKTFEPGDADISRMEKAVIQAAKEGQRTDASSALHFSLGKAYTDIGDIGRAGYHYHEAHRLRRAQAKYDAQHNSAWMAEIAKFLSKEFMESREGVGTPSEVPIFIVGMPNSGTSQVAQILSVHQQVFDAGELKTIQIISKNIAGPDGNAAAFPASLAYLDATDFAELGEYYLSRFAALAPEKRRVVDRMPLNFMYLGFIHLILPHARIIHCRRNPIDTCMSYYCMPPNIGHALPHDLSELGSFYKSYLELMQHWRSTLPSRRLLEIDYEDIIADPQGSTLKLMEFCGLAWDGAGVSLQSQPAHIQWAEHANIIAPLLTSLGYSQPGQVDSTERQSAMDDVTLFAQKEQEAAAAYMANELERAEALSQELIEQGHATLVVWRTLAGAMRQQGKIDEALRIQEMLVNAAPGNFDVRFELAETLLLTGDFERGWREYQYRYGMVHTQHMERKVQRPAWNGQALPGKTLLIHDEQGYGDTFQFLRMVSWAKQRSGARIVLQIQSDQASFARRMPEIDEIVLQGTLPPPFDAHCRMMNLPRALKLKIADLPGPMPYLSVDPRRLEHWRDRLRQLPRPIVALAWAGRETHLNDHNRSMSLETLAPLAIDGISFVSIQKGAKAAEAKAPPAAMHLTALGDEINDFDDTAAILSICDLLISVDSSPVHLAGALNRPTWVMLPLVPDWRWLLNRDDTPWYPNTRLFRQTKRSDWSDVTDRIATGLRQMLA